MKKKVMIVEDHEEMRILYNAVLRRVGELEIVYQAESGEDALEKLPQFRPDLIIADVSLPGMDGIALTERVDRLYPNIKVLVVTGHDLQRYEKRATEAGADSLIMKGSITDIIAAVKDLLNLD